jgi:ATP-dependent DNA helicase PIF1
MAIYPRLHEGQATNEYLHVRAILAPRNKEVSLINAMVLNYLPGAQVDFLSADSAEDTEVVNTYPSEFLNTLEVSGMPSHKLLLKIGAPMSLLCNLDPSPGLCNGMGMIVQCFTMQVVEAEIITGKGAGNVAFIPRIKFISDNNGLPFTFVRKQFPFRLAYAMTINKSQGQTLSHVGLHLADDIFRMANFMLPSHAPRHQGMSKFSCQTLCMAGLALCTMLYTRKPSFEATCIS